MAKKDMQINGDKVRFTCNVSGGDLPKGWSIELDIEINYAGVTREELLKCCSGGSSARVQYQNKKLRLMKPAELEAIKAAGVHRITFAQATAASATPQDKLAKLDFAAFWDVLKPYGVSEEGARKMFNKKHGIVEPEEEIEDDEYEDDNDDE